MNRILVAVGWLFVFPQLSQQLVEENADDHYVAAVVEFSPRLTKNNGWVTVKENAETYVEYIEKAKQQEADIIVFPEDGLTSVYLPDKSEMDSWATVVPSPVEEHVPCTQNRTGVSEAFKLLSCAARNHGIYVVVNIAEKECCDPNSDTEKPSANATRYHNTNVAFDRTGKVIARYRKVNLYMEEQFDTVEPPEIVTFDTDFGVKFGTFICFDILFSVPALNLTRIENVTNIVYSTAWFSESPFLTAAQTQYGWSYAENVNLLAAGYNRPEVGNTGSGIYLGRNGIADAIMSHQSGNRLLVSRVPKTTGSRKTRLEQTERNSAGWSDALDNCYETKSNGEAVQGIFVIRDNIRPFVSVSLNESSSIDETICHRGFCCNVRANVTKLDPDAPLNNYRAVVYNGCRLYGAEVEADIRACALTLCSNDSIASCGVVARSNVAFTGITITATVHDFSSTRMLAMPSVLNSSLLPFEHWTYDAYTSDAGTNFTLTLTEPANDLATFGIYIRDFRDNQPNNVTEIHVPSVILFSILASSVYLLANRL
ncbi:vanin-like protein 1 [Nomia melanderi]|uniref:vanin-like protein 1 n=1 Tax=Nomia melanderi TaxID=2448451 RepID=UPI003FCC68BA